MEDYKKKVMRANIWMTTPSVNNIAHIRQKDQVFHIIIPTLHFQTPFPLLK